MGDFQRARLQEHPFLSGNTPVTPTRLASIMFSASSVRWKPQAQAVKAPASIASLVALVSLLGCLDAVRILLDQDILNAILSGVLGRKELSREPRGQREGSQKKE